MHVRVVFLTHEYPHPWRCAKGVWKRIPEWVKITLFAILALFAAGLADGPPR